MKSYIMCLCAGLLLAFANGCATVEETTAPEAMDALTVSIDVPADLVTDTTADIIFTKSKPAHYRIEVIGPVYGQTNDYVEGDDFDVNFNTFVLPESGLNPNTSYLVLVYMDDQDGNTASAFISFRTKPAMNPELTISSINMLENYGGTNARAISFDLNKQAFWEVHVDDATTGSGYYTIETGVGTGTVAAPLYLTSGHNYWLRILAYTQEGDFKIEVISLGTW